MIFIGLRVALVGPLAPPAGGMANQMVQLGDLLRQEGAVVTIVQTNRPYVPRWIARLRGARAVARLLPYFSALWGAIGASDIVHVMANSGWSWHLFAVPALRIARLRSVPCIIHYHGGEAESFLDRSAPRVIPALCTAAALIVPSRFLQDVFARHGVNSRVVPNVIDLALFTTRPRCADRSPHLVIARNLERVYDIPTAVHAFAVVRRHLPGARLSIAGRGPEEPGLRRLAEELGLEAAITFTGRLATSDVAALLARADIMLNPSTADNLPVSILEAMASGVAVVSTRAGGIPCLVRDGETGLLVNVGDSQGMADAALRLLSDRPLRTRITEAACADVQQYGPARVHAALASAYDAVLRRGASARRTA